MAGRPIHRDEHFASLHPRMIRRRRAKLFAPLNALDGHSVSIDSKNIEYVERIDLEKDDRRELDRRIRILHGLTYDGKIAWQIVSGSLSATLFPVQMRTILRSGCAADMRPLSEFAGKSTPM